MLFRSLTDYFFTISGSLILGSIQRKERHEFEFRLQELYFESRFRGLIMGQNKFLEVIFEVAVENGVRLFFSVSSQ